MTHAPLYIANPDIDYIRQVITPLLADCLHRMQETPRRLRRHLPKRRTNCCKSYSNAFRVQNRKVNARMLTGRGMLGSLDSERFA